MVNNLQGCSQNNIIEVCAVVHFSKKTIFYKLRNGHKDFDREACRELFINVEFLFLHNQRTVKFKNRTDK